MSFHPQMPYGTVLWHKSERKLADEGPPFAFTAENRAALDRIAERYPPDRRKSALLPALYLVQDQQGYITRNAMRHVAEAIGCTSAEVEDVVSYYVMFFTQPMGRYIIQVCRTLSCALLGAGRLTEELSRAIGVGVNETDAARQFTLMEMECLGACDRAPVVMVNNEFWHECQQPQAAAQLVADLRTRGLAALSGCHLKKE
jgi:NADH-quinone oxidoreductase subunit E